MKMLKIAGLIFVFVVVLCVIAISFSPPEEKIEEEVKPEKIEKEVKVKEKPVEEPKEKGVHLIGESQIKTEEHGLRHVVGQIKNDTSRSYKYVQVEINLYDAEGTQVGSTLANVNNLEPGSVWEFKAPIFEEKVVIAKIKAITKW